MKKMSKEAQVQANGGEVYWFHRYAGQCTTSGCIKDSSYSSNRQKDVLNWGYNHHITYCKKNAPHRWAYLRCG